MTEEIKKDSQFELYKKEMEFDLQIDRVNLEEKQLKLPALKGKWVGRLMTHKKEKDKLNELYQQAIKQIAEKIKKEAVIELSSVAAEKQAESHELAKKIKKEIKEHEHIIEYLERMEKHLSNITYDIKNITEMMKLEIA
jgi:gas vesicle protein